MIAVLDKGVYQLFLDEKELKSIINGNLLKLCHDMTGYELIIIVKYKSL